MSAAAVTREGMPRKVKNLSEKAALAQHIILQSVPLLSQIA
jgi:hypothetical protein